MRELWHALSGHKRTIAAVAGPALTWAMAKGWLSGDDAAFASLLLTAWSGVAIGHGLGKRTEK